MRGEAIQRQFIWWRDCVVRFVLRATQSKSSLGAEVGLLGCDGCMHRHRLCHTALEDDLANVVEALDMFIGSLWICRDCANAMVGLPHNIEGKGPILSKTETVSRPVRQFTRQGRQRGHRRSHSGIA